MEAYGIAGVGFKEDNRARGAIMTFPTISIVTLNYNADPRIWKKVLESIRKQDYPKAAIEHLVMDGGSTNASLSLAKQYGCIIHSMPRLRNNSEGRKGWGIKLARNNVIAFIEADNILVGKDWFRKMVLPFIHEKDVIGTFSMHNSYERDMPALTRYCALIGINDPTVYYLGKSEKMPRFEHRYTKGIPVKDTKDYMVVRFTRNSLPTLGDNGHMVRRSVITKVNMNPEKFLHTDAFYQLAGRGYDTYGVVKNSIIHYTGSAIFGLYKRRVAFKRLFFDTKRTTRSYYVFNKDSSSDKLRLALFVIYSLTFIQPLLISVRGFVAVPDSAWFLHPIVCFIAACSYGLTEVSYRINNYLKRLYVK